MEFSFTIKLELQYDLAVLLQAYIWRKLNNYHENMLYPHAYSSIIYNLPGIATA